MTIKLQSVSLAMGYRVDSLPPDQSGPETFTQQPMFVISPPVAYRNRGNDEKTMATIQRGE
jgi:hypothetical protein